MGIPFRNAHISGGDLSKPPSVRPQKVKRNVPGSSVRMRRSTIVRAALSFQVGGGGGRKHVNGIPWRDKGGMRISTARSCGQRLRAGLGVPRHKQERRRCRRRTVEPFRETNLLLGTMRRWLAEATRPRPFGESLSRSISAQPSHFLCRFCSHPRGRGVEGGGGEGGEDHGYPLDAVHVRARARADDTKEGRRPRVTGKPT